MIYFDVKNDLVLVNEKVADLKTLTYVTDQNTINQMLLQFEKFSKLNEATTATTATTADTGVATQTLSTLASYGDDLLGWGVPKLLKYLKDFLPNTIEGWIHLGVDVISLICDILGPFTAGIGSGVSAAIDVVHGVYYIGASQNWTGFPDRRDKEFEYLLCGFITLGFAAIPIGGNAGSIGFKTFLKKNPITKDITIWLEKLFKSSIGKYIEKVFKWIIEKAGSLGRFFYDMFAKLTNIPIVGGIFKMLGNVLKNGIAQLSKSLDSLLLKFFEKPGIYEYFEKKYGKEYAEKHLKVLVEHSGTAAKVGKAAAEKDAAKAAAKTGNEVEKELAKSHKAGYKDLLKTIPAYKSITSKLKMMLSQVIADKVNVTSGINDIWKLLISKVGSKDTAVEKLKEAGLPVEKYNKWYLDYAFFLDEAEREDNDLSTADVEAIQNYLIEYSETYEGKDVPTVTGKIDAKTILATRQLFNYLINQDTSELESEELDKSKELIELCEDGIKELNKLDKGFFSSLKDKISTTSESYLANFETFNR